MKKNKFIIFLGVDGSGKSTVIRELEKLLEISYRFHFCPIKRYNFDNSKINNTPHTQKVYNTALSIIKILFLIIVFNYGYIVNIKSNLLLGHVIADRYFYDLLIDKQRYRIKISDKLLDRLIKLIPKPDYVVLIIGNPKELYLRKQEISLSEIDKQQNRAIKYFQYVDKKNVYNSSNNTAKDIAFQIESSLV